MEDLIKAYPLAATAVSGFFFLCAGVGGMFKYTRSNGNGEIERRHINRDECQRVHKGVDERLGRMEDTLGDVNKGVIALQARHD